MSVRTSVNYMADRLKRIYDYRNMISSLVKRDLKGRYRNSVFGFLWNFMNPLFQIMIYFIVFSALMSFGMDSYYVFLTAGMIPWFFFSSSMTAGSGCIVNQAGMVSKINFPREVIPIVLVTSNLVNFLISYAFVLALIAITGYGFSGIALLFLPIIVIIQYLFTLGIVFLTSSIDVYYRDISSIVGVLMMGMIWITPVIYRDYFGSEVLQTILKYNPMTYFMNIYHDILYFKVIPGVFDLFVCSLLAIITLIGGWMIFVKLQHGFAEKL
jgi:ABC-type polysaccharide/polyol phosphate export systems, permease component